MPWEWLRRKLNRTAVDVCCWHPPHCSEPTSSHNTARGVTSQFGCSRNSLLSYFSQFGRLCFDITSALLKETRDPSSIRHKVSQSINKLTFLAYNVSRPMPFRICSISSLNGHVLRTLTHRVARQCLAGNHICSTGPLKCSWLRHIGNVSGSVELFS